jgi:hypothetical protein
MSNGMTTKLDFFEGKVRAARALRLLALACSTALITSHVEALEQTTAAGAREGTPLTPEQPAPAATVAPPVATQAAVPSPPAAIAPAAVGVWLRAGVTFQDAQNPRKLNDARVDTLFAEVNASGKINEYSGVFINVDANGQAGTFEILDAVVSLDFATPLHLWLGQVLIPVDRANKSGPFFMIPWNYPGLFRVGNTFVPVTPQEGRFGRSVGAVAWGDLAEGKFKYYAGAFVPPNVNDSPLYSGRLSTSLIGKETGFGQRSTFYGEQNILALAVGAQYQHNASVGPAPADPAQGTAPRDDFSEVNADILAEFQLGNAAFVTGELDLYQYFGDYNPAKQQLTALAAYASPVIGWGQLQPMVRYQYAANGDRKETMLDASLGYLLRQQRLRFWVGYNTTRLEGQPGGGPTLVGNAVQLSVQAMHY